MTDMNSLKTEILNSIKDDNIDLTAIKKVLSPIGDYIADSSFTSNLNIIIDSITKDRNDDNKFTLDDLILIKGDISTIITLVNAILLIIGGLPNFKLKYDSSTTELILFKLITYIFLVIVPTKTNGSLTLNEKTDILDTVIAIYNVIKMTKMAKNLIDKINSWFTSGGCCSCICTQPDKLEVINSMLPTVADELSSNISYTRKIKTKN